MLICITNVHVLDLINCILMFKHKFVTSLIYDLKLYLFLNYYIPSYTLAHDATSKRDVETT